MYIFLREPISGQWWYRCCWVNILLNWNQNYPAYHTGLLQTSIFLWKWFGGKVYFLQESPWNIQTCFFHLLLLLRRGPFPCCSCSEPRTVRWQWWIFCVHTKHTKGSDKGRINSAADILTEMQRGTRYRGRSWERGKKKSLIVLTRRFLNFSFLFHSCAWGFAIRTINQGGP